MTAVGISCAVVGVLGLAYALLMAQHLTAGRLTLYVGRAQAMRRVVGALLVVLLMLLVHIGLERLDPYRNPSLFAWVWLGAVVLVLLLLGLALLDLRELRANLEIARTRRLIELESELRRTRGDLGEEG